MIGRPRRSGRLQGRLGALIKGIVASFAGLFAVGLIGTLVQSLTVRQLGPERYGEYTLLLTSLAFLSSLLGFGLDTWVLKDGGQHPERLADDVWQILLLKAAGALIIGVALAIGWVGHAQYNAAFLLGVVGAALSAFIQTVYAALRARQRNGQVALFQALEPILLLAALLLTSANDLSVLLLMAVRVGCYIVLFVLLLRRLSAVCGLIHYHLNPLRGLRGAWLYLVSDGLANVYSQAPTAILGATAGTLAVGLFRPPLDIIMLLYALPTLGFYVALPILSSADIGRAEYRRLLLTILGGALLYGVGAMAGIMLFGGRAIDALAGPEYRESLRFMLLLAPLPLLKAGSFVAAAVMLSRDRVQYRVFVQAAVALACVGLGWLIIPRYGSDGAAALVLLIEALLLALYTVAAWLAYRRNPPRAEPGVSRK